MTRASDAIVVDDGSDDDDDDDDDDAVAVAASTTRATTFGERANARVRAFDDFTAAFVANESLDVSGRRDGARGNAATRWSDEAFARAIRCELREPEASDGCRRAPRGDMLARLAKTAKGDEARRGHRARGGFHFTPV